MGFWTSYYRVKLHCRNCEFVTDYQIEEGVPVEAAAKHVRCRRCKCVNTLEREQFPMY